MNVILSHLAALYGDAIGQTTFERVLSLMARYRSQIPAPRAQGLTERDAILITYGDQVQSPNTPPLATLGEFTQQIAGLVSTVHILPFFPYSSDDGFAVIDYRQVKPALGDWGDIARLGLKFRLMFDAVCNHVSAESEWFRRFLADDPRYRDFFIVVPAGADLSHVVRPRALPLLTRFVTASGAKNVWTTFSADQVDLNYHNPDVLVGILDTLLSYAAHGAEFIRLDAVAFLWKEYGTTCLHLPQTHRIVQLMRAVLDQVAPHVMLVTETNVPHADNVSYFGNGSNEAQMVYNFALPPLVLHAFYSGNARILSDWASGLTLPSDHTTFFNFLASHDGIGLNPARGILTDADINALVARTLAHGGLVSYKNNTDGTTAPYELNINYFDALSNPAADEPLDTQVARFIASQAIMLSLLGVPGIYFHSLVGSRGWRAGAVQAGQNRKINREKCDRAELERQLADPRSQRHAVLNRYRQLLQARTGHPAFDPHGAMQILDAGESIFAVLRGDRQVLCLHNVSNQAQPIEPGVLNAQSLEGHPPLDLISGETCVATSLKPYQVLWLAAKR